MKKHLPKKSIFPFVVFLFSLFSLNAQTVQTFTTSGSWTCPPGVTSIMVETWGGGGAGGGGAANPSVGGGGGGGAYTLTGSVAVTSGTTYNYIVGTGGVGTTGVGPSGSASSFNALYTANFGTGGGTGAATATAGAGGAGSFSGGNGAAGSVALSTAGGGGGGAGSGANGGAAAAATGGTGGTGGGGTGGNGRTTTGGIGLAGTALGAGGGGAFANSSTTRKGGNGANGQVRITYTINCTAPTAQPTALILNAGGNIITGSFTAALNTDGYIIIRTATATAPTNPVNGTTYIAGTSALGGYIESVGSPITFNSFGLSPLTQYWYWVYGFDNLNCVGSIKYNTTSPLTGNAITTSCGALTNNATITTPGSATYNWSTLAWSLGHVPTSCENAEIFLNISTATSTDQIIINLDVDFTVLSLKMKNMSSDPYVHIFQTSGTRTINILGDLNITSPGGNIFNRTAFSNQLLTTINGNLTLGNAIRGPKEGHSAIGSNGTTPDQTYVLKGNMTFNPRGYTTDEWTKFIFDKPGTQYLYNYTTPQPTPYVQGVGDTLQPVLFEKLVVGNTNATNLIFAGTGFDGYMELMGRGGVIIGVNSTLDLPANFSINQLTDPGYLPSYFQMLSGSKLRLGGDRTISPNAIVYGVPGSNFPGSFSPYTFDATSTVEYYGSNAITQTIHNVPTYANLIATNGSGSGRAQKITIAPITVNTTFNINALADVTLGVLGSSTQTVASAGPLNIQPTGGLYCNANVVSGAGAFTMGNGSYLGMGHALGISLLGTPSGNIQMTGGRSYNTTGNYIYNGLVTQITCTGLPATVNDFTTDNPTTVTIATNQIINGVDSLKQGVFDIGTTTITHNGTGRLNSIGGKMKANLGVVQMKGTSGIAQALSGSWFVNKTISSLINSNSTGITVAVSPADTLLISSALLYGAVTNSAITTNGNLTLLSRDTGTARFGEVVSGSGNSITGKVNIERYLFARKSWRLLATPIVIGTSPNVTSSWREAANMASTGYGTQITGPYGAPAGMDVYTQRASMKYYSPSINNFIDIANTNTSAVANNEGYYVFVRGDRSVPVAGAAAATNLRLKGDIRVGNQVFTVPSMKFQSFGNPYPSRIDYRTVVKSNLSSSFYAWNPNSAGLYNVGAYELYTLSAGNYVKVPGGTIRNFIESGEAVYVQSNSATAGSVTVREADKTSSSALVSFTRKKGGVTEDNMVEGTDVSSPTLEVNLYAQGVGTSSYLADGFLMNFDNIYSPNVDNNDVRKIINASDNLAVNNGTYLLIVERKPEPRITDTIKMSLTGTRIAPYRLEINPTVLKYPALQAFLKDKFLATETQVSLADTTNYTFNITADAASKVADRFMIIFKHGPPVRFTNITAVRNRNNTATVTWNTENENNINTYSIEHSTDAVNFAAAGSQMPTANNGGSPSYNFVHTTPVDANNWYRVKANTISGAAQYSDVVKIGAVEIVRNPSISIYPNPATAGNVNVRFTNQPVGTYQLKISNKAGQLLHTEIVQLQTNNLQKTISLGATAAGSYQVTITNEDGKKTSIGFFIK